MSKLSLLTFTAERSDDGDDAIGPLALTPVIDNVSLVSRATVFEEHRGFDVPGGYGGLVPSRFRFGDLRTYFLGAQEDQFPQARHLWLLGCDCGEVGCWPLTARAVVLDETITWTDFAQDHRPARDYSGFGPFVFARDQYERAVEWAVNVVEAEAG